MIFFIISSVIRVCGFFFFEMLNSSPKGLISAEQNYHISAQEDPLHIIL